MALSKNSKILASDVTGAIKSITRSGTTFTYTTLGGSTGTFTQQDNNTTYSAGTGISISSNKITNTGVTSVNGKTGAVTISSGISAVKGEIGSVVASNSVSMTLPSGGTWFVWNTASYSHVAISGYEEPLYFGVKNTNSSSSGTFYEMGGNFAGGTTVYAKSSSGTSGTVGKVVAVRVS